VLERSVDMPLKTILEQPEHEFDDEDWEDDDLAGEDEEIDLEELDEGLDEEEGDI
jgi:hypothetical protein